MLVRVIAVAALFALAALIFPFLVAPTVVYVVIVAILVGLDWAASRHEAAPWVERVIPDRMVKGLPVELRYRISRPRGAATVISILDELPADLGGDLFVDQVPVVTEHKGEGITGAIPPRL